LSSAAPSVTRAGDIALAKIRAIFWCLVSFKQLWQKHIYLQRLIRRVPDSAIAKLMLRPGFHVLRKSVRVSSDQKRTQEEEKLTITGRASSRLHSRSKFRERSNDLVV